jgi:hypothetical protein
MKSKTFLQYLLDSKRPELTKLANQYGLTVQDIVDSY